MQQKTSGVDTKQAFWQWFTANEKRLTCIDTSDTAKAGKFIEELIENIKPFNPWLKALAGPHGDGRHELIITSDGDIALFCKAEELVAAAPEIKGWLFTPHKPPMGPENIRIMMFGKEFSSDTLHFYAHVNELYPDEVSIILTHPEYSIEDDQQFQAAAMIYLENTLGEVNTATKIDWYEMGPPPQPENGIELIPMSKLNDYLTWREKEFVEKTESFRKQRPPENFSVIEGTDTEGKLLFATIDAAFQNWEYRSAYPWLLQVDITYEPNASGLPDKKQMEEMQAIEDEITAVLPQDDSIYFLGHKTHNNIRSIFFYCSNFNAHSKILHRYVEQSKWNYEVMFFIRKDKYWRTVEQFY